MVDYGNFGNKNWDGGDHFITLIGYGSLNGEFYFQFWDNYFSIHEYGTYADNKLFLRNDLFELDKNAKLLAKLKDNNIGTVLPYRITNIRYNTKHQ